MIKIICAALLTAALVICGTVFAANNSNIDPNLIQKAEQGDADAQFELGLAYRKHDDFVNSKKWYEKSAAQGNMDAMVGLALRYLYGQGVKQNIKRAAELYKTAFPDLLKKAELGDTDKQVNIAIAYEHGLGVEKDAAKAFFWNEKAAQQGNEWGQNNIGYAYLKGLGVNQDYSKARYWLTKAAEHGNLNAINNLKKLPPIRDTEYYENIQLKSYIIDCENEAKIKLDINRYELQNCEIIDDFVLKMSCKERNFEREQWNRKDTKENGPVLIEACMYKKNYRVNDQNQWEIITK